MLKTKVAVMVVMTATIHQEFVMNVMQDIVHFFF